MKYLTYASIGAGVCLLAAVIATWTAIPSGTELRAHALSLSYATEVLDRNGRYLTYLQSPDLVAVGNRVGDSGYNRPGPFVSIDEVPEDLVDDLITIEDLQPLGFSSANFLRAAFTRVGGGSTISQQVYSSLVAYKEQTIWRKWSEMIGAVKLSLHFSRKEVLETYINRISWTRGPTLGLAHAARQMYDKHPSELQRHEWLILMSRISQPSASLHTREQAYYNRVNLLYNEGNISETERDQLIEEWTDETSSPSTPRLGPFVDRVRDQLHQLGGDQTASALEITTTLDARVQATANEHLSAIEHEKEGKPTFLLMNSKKEVLGYYGNPNPGDLDLLQEPVPSASRFKTLVYAQYIDELQRRGVSSEAIQQHKLPTRFELDSGQVITDNRASGTSASLRRSLLRSYNASAYEVADRIGADELASFVRSFNISIQPHLSAALGTESTAELDLTAAYATLLLRGGRSGERTFIQSIRDRRTGDALYPNDEEDEAVSSDGDAVVSEQTSQTLRAILGATTRIGTAQELTNNDHEDSLWRVNNLSAKTGTTQLTSEYRVLGLTGTIGQHAYSFSLQGENVSRSAYSSTAVVPLARRTLYALCDGNHIEC